MCPAAVPGTLARTGVRGAAGAAILPRSCAARRKTEAGNRARWRPRSYGTLAVTFCSKNKFGCQSPSLVTAALEELSSLLSNAIRERDTIERSKTRYGMACLRESRMV